MNLGVDHTEVPLLRRLKDCALWIIMDAWAEQPHDLRRFSTVETEMTTRYNAMCVRRLEDYLKGVNTKLNSCYANSDNDICEAFRDLPNITSPEEIIAYCNEHNFESLVYVGFHHGICVAHRPTGYLNMQKHIKCYVKQSLCYPLPFTPFNDISISQQAIFANVDIV